jgi:predicted Ser/Thr protein kinase
MHCESEILDLIVQWEEQRAAGRELSPEELCRDCPDLIEEIEARLQSVAVMNNLLDTRGSAPHAAADSRPIATSHPSRRDPLRPESWPDLPGYEILEEMGRGGMGIVYKARQIALGRLVAVKLVRADGLIPEDWRRRFTQEAKAMALLQHPNVVQIHEIGRQREQQFLVMEYVEGQSLAASLVEGPWPARKAAEFVAIVARAMHAAHQQGVIHRDLKPGNILIAADGTPKICDFGLAKHWEQTADQTATGQLVGTPSYMAPEQVLGAHGTLGPAVDIYAMGAVLYELLTGRAAFMADNPLQILQLISRQEPVPPRQWQPAIPRDIETICLKCLAKDSRRRYATASDLADDLARFLANQPIHARPVGPIGRGWRWCRRHPSIAALMGMATVAIVLVLAVVLGYNHRLACELDRTEAARQQVLATQEKLHGKLAQEIAHRLDGDLRELAATPLAMAALVEAHRDWDEGQMEQVLKNLLAKSPLILGSCVAFEPCAWKADRKDFALYVFRRRDGFVVKQLLPPAYLPHYRQWEWYERAKSRSQGSWSEPYVDDSADRTPMVTFSAPLHRDGRFIGVVTADLAMDYFRDLRSQVDHLELGLGNYCIVISAGKKILSHPASRFKFPEPASDLTTIDLDESFRRLVDQWARCPAGGARAVDFSTRQPASFFYARVPSAGWTLVTVIY